MSETISGDIFIPQQRFVNRRTPELRPQDANLMNLLIQENMNHNLSDGNGNGDDEEVNQTNNIHALGLLRDITRDLLSVNHRFHTPGGIFQGLFGPFMGMGGMGGLNIQEILQRSLLDMGGVHKYVSDDVIKELKEPIGDERLDGNGEIATCSICMESIGMEPVEDAPCVSLPCKHHFHKECILPWFKENNKCPDCRQEMPFEEKSSRSATEPTTEPLTEPVTEPLTEPTTEPVTESEESINPEDNEEDQYERAIETLMSHFRNTRVPHNINYTVREITPNLYSMEVRNSTLQRMVTGINPPMPILGGPRGVMSPPMTILGDLSPPMTILRGPRGGLNPSDQEQYELNLAIQRSLEDLSGL